MMDQIAGYKGALASEICIGEMVSGIGEMKAEECGAGCSTSADRFVGRRRL